MAYVKISDPKIIDLSTIHQIVNVVNQHSDNITALTSNFGSTFSGSTATTLNGTTSYQFDISSQQIMYGKSTIDSTSSTWHNVSSTMTYYSVPVTFVGTPFSAAPIVTASISINSTTDPKKSALTYWVGGITPTSFTFYFRSVGTNTDWIAADTKFYFNWTAIGPK
jgi:hypothetical protein